MKPQQSLVDKAKSFQRQPRKRTSPEERELALAWMRGEITLGQASKALKGIASGAVLYRFAVCLRDEYQAGRLVQKRAA